MSKVTTSSEDVPTRRSRDGKAAVSAEASSLARPARPTTQYAVSADGTRIAYEVRGTGPALVIVDGALCQRSMGPSRPLAERLAAQFTVHTYDRRGRGESEPGRKAYHPDREVEDLAAVITAAGGHAHAFVLRAAQAGVPIDRIVVYEAPFIVDDTHAPLDLQLGERTRALVEDGRSGDAVKLFMRTVGAPGPLVAVMRVLPVWKKLISVAPTLPHDYAIVLDRQQGKPLPEGAYDAVTQPALVIAGGKSPAYMKNSQAAIAEALSAGRLETLPGQTHMIKAKVTAPVVAAHLTSD
jgi:pimeloyl-ACP methyl ester carboxylesterase